MFYDAQWHGWKLFGSNTRRYLIHVGAGYSKITYEGALRAVNSN